MNPPPPDTSATSTRRFLLVQISKQLQKVPGLDITKRDCKLSGVFGLLERGGPTEALQHNLIINIPLFIPQTERAITKHVASCHPHPRQR